MPKKQYKKQNKIVERKKHHPNNKLQARNKMNE